jgi:hypothetical protein
MPLSLDDTRVRLVKTAFVIYNHENLDQADHFLNDFGLLEVERINDGREIFYRGYGPDPFVYLARKAATSSFGGAAYTVENREELEKATRIENATPILPLNYPGGGEIVTLTDPAGFHVHLVYGVEAREAHRQLRGRKATTRKIPTFQAWSCACVQMGSLWGDISRWWLPDYV